MDGPRQHLEYRLVCWARSAVQAAEGAVGLAGAAVAVAWGAVVMEKPKQAQVGGIGVRYTLFWPTL